MVGMEARMELHRKRRVGRLMGLTHSQKHALHLSNVLTFQDVTPRYFYGSFVESLSGALTHQRESKPRGLHNPHLLLVHTFGILLLLLLIAD